MTTPVECPRRVSYSWPAWITMKCSASVETARYSPRSRRLGRPKTRPISAPTAAEAGSVTQNEAPISLNRIPVVKAPAASSPACPSEIWPA